MKTAKEVGGDFYDFYFTGEDSIAFLIADVSGKGIPAAMFMMRAKTMIKNLAETSLSVEKVFCGANNELCKNNEANMFVTSWMGVLNIKTGKVSYADAGHNYPLILKSDGTVKYLKTKTNLVLAGMENINYAKNEFQLSKGDMIILYTDGVTEAVDSGDNLYGNDRLLNIIEENKYITDPEKICSIIKNDIDKFVGSAEQFDDITILCMRYNGADDSYEADNTICTDALTENIATVTDFVISCLKEKECPSKVQNQIGVAIDEIFGNIAKYAYTPDVGKATLSVDVDEMQSSVSVTFTDSGRPYNPLQRKDPDTQLGIDERSAGGLGIYLVKKIMSEVKYEYRDSKNILTIKKNF
jgi:sigma-B regulation protein RsbU (phosphoserine phosphatase)